jgi:hypothetical protein
VNFKYHPDSPNLFCCEDSQASPFWKGMLWAAKATKMGYRWKIGNGKRVRFWEDLWFGSCSLAIQYWRYILLSMSSVVQFMMPRMGPN